GGSDSCSFDQAGLAGIGMGQDPIEYGTHTWHTNLDTYERILEDDVKKDAMVIAWSVYQLAMRDDLLPRFLGRDMPAKPEEISAQPAIPPVRTDAQAPAKTTRPRASTRKGRGGEAVGTNSPSVFKAKRTRSGGCGTVSLRRCQRDRTERPGQ